MSCDPRELQNLREALLKKPGYTTERVNAIIEAIKLKATNEAFKKEVALRADSPILTEEENQKARRIFGTLDTRIKKLLDSGGRLDDTWENILKRTLSPEDIEDLGRIKSKLDIAAGRVATATSYLDVINEKIEKHKEKQVREKLGTKEYASRESVITALEELKEKEERRLARMPKPEDMLESDRIRNELNTINQLAELAAILVDSGQTEVQAKFIGEFQALKVQRGMIERNLKVLYKRLRQEKANKEEIKKSIEETKKQLQDIETQIAAKLKEGMDAAFIDKDGNATFDGKSLEEVIKTLNKKASKLSNRLITLNLKDFARSMKVSSKQIASKLAREAKLTETLNKTISDMRDYVTGYFAVAEETGGLKTTMDLATARLLLGDNVFNHYIKNERAKKTLADGTEVPNRDDELTKDEMFKAIEIFKRFMRNSLDRGFFHSDLAIVNDEAMEMLKAMATRQEILDIEDPELMDFMPEPNVSLSQVIDETRQNGGKVPDENKAKTGKDLAKQLELTIGKLQSLKANPGFRGSINEGLLRIVLHRSLYDLSPEAFASALKPTPKRKNMTSPLDLVDPMIQKKGILKDLGIENPESLPEFNNPDWHNSWNKILAFDIETDNILAGKITKVFSVQTTKFENGEKNHAVWVNVGGRIVNGLNVPREKREPLTKDQLEFILKQVEQDQNSGFKVVGHSSNRSDFPLLTSSLGVDANLMARIALRSFDTLANLGFDNKNDENVSGMRSKFAPGGARLKDIVKDNLPPSTKTPDIYGGRIIYRNGVTFYVTDETDVDGKKIEKQLQGKETEEYFETGNTDGDWTKFDAYAVNDTDITVDLVLHLTKESNTSIKLTYKGVNYSIETRKPRSNLFLDVTPGSDGKIGFGDITKPFLSHIPAAEQKAGEISNFISMEYNVDSVIEILEGWLIEAWASDPDNRAKLDLLTQGLEKQNLTVNQVYAIVREKANSRQTAVKPLLKKLFNQYGFVLELNVETNSDGEPVYRINPENTEVTLDEKDLYTPSNKDLKVTERMYSHAVMESLIDYISDLPGGLNAFAEMLVKDFGTRPVDEGETAEFYIREVVPELLKKYIPGFTSVVDFGNATLDWKPANEVGIAIAQVLKNQEPGITQVESLYLTGQEFTTTLTDMTERSVYDGRPKRHVVPDKTRVHFASPFSPVEEDRAYDNFRLLKRVKFILSQDLTPEQVEAIWKWGTTPQKMNRQDAISAHVSAVSNTVFPDIVAKGPFDNVMSLEERQQSALELMYDVPRLLSVFNHDCTYTGLNMGGRFIRDSEPVYYRRDWMSAGSPTAMSIIAGAIDQVAFMSNFAPDNELADEELLNTIKEGIRLIRERQSGATPVPTEELLEPGNKSDYSYAGKHIIVAALVFYGKSSFSDINDILKALGHDVDLTADFDPETSERLPKSKLKDPRFELLRIMEEEIEKITPTDAETKYRLNGKEIEILKSALGKIRSKPAATRKEFLKGAITPRFYQAGFNGIFEGLVNKEKEANIGLSKVEIRLLTKLMLRNAMNSHLKLIDDAIGLSQGKDGDIDKLANLLSDKFKPLSREKAFDDAFTSDWFGEQTTADRFNSMKKYFTAYVNIAAEELVPFNAPDRENKVNKLKKQLMEDYEFRLEEAAKHFRGENLKEMTPMRRAELMSKVNEILLTKYELKDGVRVPSGVTKEYQKHLVLWSLARRNQTSYRLLADNLALHQLLTGTYIDPHDYAHALNKPIFHQYGLEIASTRQHMFGGYGNGPESSKLAQVRVEEGEESDINPLGIWNIEDFGLPKEYWKKAFAQQILLDLAPYYMLPTEIGYNPNEESLEQYFEENRARSLRELEAAKLTETRIGTQDQKDDLVPGVTFKGKPMTRRMYEARVSKFAGTPAERFRLRTLAGDSLDVNQVISLDNAVDGLGSYRPLHADLDFTQRGIYSLVEMQYRIKQERTRESRLLQHIAKAKENNEGIDPNQIIPQRLRGHSSIWSKDSLPFLPAQTTDTVGSIITGPKTIVEQKAIRLQNELTAWAKLNGWDDLLEQQDWPRLYLLGRLHGRSLRAGIQELMKISDTNRFALVEAKVKMYDSMFKNLGITARAFLANKNYSTIDLMTSKADRDKIGVTAEQVAELKDKYPDGLSWLQVLVFLSDRIDRLAPIQLGVAAEEGIVVRGRPGLLKNATRVIPIQVFALEVKQIQKLILTSEVFRKEATKYLKANHPDIWERIVTEEGLDSNGFVFLEKLPLNETIQLNIAREAIKDSKELARELNSKMAFIWAGNEENALKIYPREAVTEETGPIATRLPGTRIRFVNSAVDNPGTLWAFTEDMLSQMLNSINNHDVFKTFELAYQTGKDIGTVETDLDILLKEENQRMFEDMQSDVDLALESVMLLSTLNPSDTDPLTITDYRGIGLDGKPRLLIDSAKYYLKPFTITVKGKAFEINLEDAMYITELLKALKTAKKLGLDEEAKQIETFMFNVLRSNDKDLELDYEKVSEKTRNIRIKAAAVQFRMLSAKSGISNLDDSILFVQEGLTKASKEKLQRDVLPVVEAMQRVYNSDPNYRQEYYYLASGFLLKQDELDPTITRNSNFIDSLVQATGKPVNVREQSLAAKALQKAFTDASSGIETVPVHEFETDVRRDVKQFADVETFTKEFGAAGENIVNQLQALVDNKSILPQTRDMMLVMIGSLAMYNRNILNDLNIVPDPTLPSTSFAEMKKQNGKYTIGLNIKAMQVTPENQILFKFAEELVHLARVKYIKQDSKEWNRLRAAYANGRSEPMIREMLIAMNQGKPYTELEKDVAYAMKNPDEFLAHFGAMILLQETVFSKDVLDAISAKYQTAHEAKVWWKRAFNSIKKTAIKVMSHFTDLKNDPYYKKTYEDTYKIVQQLLFNTDAIKRDDVGNADVSFNAAASISTIERMLSPAEMEARRVDYDRYHVITDELNRTELTDAARTALQTEQAELNGRLTDMNLNPLTVTGLRIAQVESTFNRDIASRRSRRGTIQLRNLDSMQSRVTLSKLLINWERTRGRRVDNKDTLAGMVRSLPGMTEGVVESLQRTWLANFNNDRFTTHSPEAIPLMITELIDAAVVTTQNSYRPSFNGGFVSEKLSFDSDVFYIQQVMSEAAAMFANSDQRQRVHANIYLSINGRPLTTTDPQEIAVVNEATKRFKLFHKNLIDTMFETGITDSPADLDRIGLRLRDNKDIPLERQSVGFNAVRNLLRNKMLRQLNEGGNAYISPHIMLLSNLLPESREALNVGTDFGNAIEILMGESRTPRPTTPLFYMMEHFYNITLQRLADARGLTVSDIRNEYITTPDTLRNEIYNTITNFVYRTREGDTRFGSEFVRMDAGKLDSVINHVRNTLSTNPQIAPERINLIRSNPEWGFYQGKSNYQIIDQTNIMDLITYEFFGKLGATAHLFNRNSIFLTSEDIFQNEHRDDQDHVAVAQQLFDHDVMSVTMSLLRGVAYDAVERTVVQQLSGIPGFYLNISQVIELARQGMLGESNRSRPYLNLNGRTETAEERRLMLEQSLDILEDRSKAARGTLSTSIQHENPALNSILVYGRAATQVAFSPNIPLATWLVEGSMGALNSTMRGSNPIRFFAEAALGNVGSFITESLGGIAGRRDGSLRLFPLNPQLTRGIARNCVFLFEDLYSPMIPGRLVTNDLTTEVVDRMNIGQRFMAYQSRSVSHAMKHLRIALENEANRRIQKYAQNGKLERLRDAVNNTLRDTPNPSNETLKQTLRNAGVRMNVEEFLYLIRSGIFEPGVLESLNYIRGAYPLERGTISIKNIKDEQYLRISGAAPVSHAGVPVTLQSLRQAELALIQFQRSWSNMVMVQNNPIDGTASSKATNILLNFYKSYPSLFMAQVLMRRGSIAPAMQMGFQLLMYSMLDMVYNVMLALASGFYDYEKLKAKLEKQELNYAEIARLLVKMPLFSNNLLGLGVGILTQALALGQNKDGIFMSIQEQALNYELGNIIKAIKSWGHYFFGEVPDKHPLIPTYNAFGRLIPGLGNTLVKMAIMQSYGDLNSRGSSGSPSSWVQDQMDQNTIQPDLEYSVREMLKDGSYNNRSKRDFSGNYLSTYPRPDALIEARKKVRKTIVDKYNQELPKMPEIKTPSLIQQGTTPETPPEGLLP